MGRQKGVPVEGQMERGRDGRLGTIVVGQAGSGSATDDNVHQWCSKGPRANRFTAAGKEGSNTLLCVIGGPFPCDAHRVLLVLLPVRGDVVREGIILRSQRSSSAPRTPTYSTAPREARTGLGALRSACTERRTVRIWRAGDHLSLRMSRQIRPSLSAQRNPRQLRY